MADRALKFCGWGYVGEGLTPEEETMVLGRYAGRFGVDGFARIATPQPEEIALPTPKVELPAKLAGLASSDPYDRLTHTYGKSFPDYVRIYDKDFANAPDIVALSLIHI